MFEHRRQNSAYRSVRYSTIRKDNFTPDLSHRLSTFKAGNGLAEESTFYNTRTLDFKPQTAGPAMFGNPETTTYMQTFTSMFHSEKKVKQNKDEESFKTYGIKLKFTNFDHSFHKDENTQFTLLDPFHRPYSYLTNEITKQKKELESQKDDLKMIRAQMNLMKRTVMHKLKNLEEQGINGVERLRQLIRKNEVECQQTKMRVRREITQLYQKHDDNVKLSQELMQKSREVQRDIFSCQPFELDVSVEAE